jgi:hypothetical protein
MKRVLSIHRGLRPLDPDQGLCPWTPLGAYGGPKPLPIFSGPFHPLPPEIPGSAPDQLFHIFYLIITTASSCSHYGNALCIPISIFIMYLRMHGRFV